MGIEDKIDEKAKQLQEQAEASKSRPIDNKAYDAVYNKLAYIISEQTGIDENEINPNSGFIQDLNADSLDVVELVMVIEDTFDMTMPDKDTEEIDTVDKAVKYIVQKLNTEGKTSKIYEPMIKIPYTNSTTTDSSPFQSISDSTYLPEISANSTEYKQVYDKFVEIVAGQMGVDKNKINPKTRFLEDLNSDSLDTVELVMEFEDEFDISIPDEEAEKINSVNKGVKYIVKALSEKR